MKQLVDIQKKLLSEGIKLYEVFSIGTIISEGLYLGGFDSFIKFMKEQNIPFAIGIEQYISPDEYIVTTDTITRLCYNATDDFVNSIMEQIQDYNDKLLSLNFDFPQYVILACSYDSHFYYTSFENNFSIDGVEICQPEERLKLILKNNVESFECAKNDKIKILEKQKNELRMYIVGDSNFYNQTNKSLRKNYIVNLFAGKTGENFPQLKEEWYREEFRSVWGEAVDFIEIIWKEIKNSLI